MTIDNWRSYRHVEFRMRPPTRKRPLVIIGAMNGVGKTTFLLSLYLGLFGRSGLRHAEGFSHFKDEDITYYRQALTKFRRNSTPADEPTVIDITFSPTKDEEEGGEKEIRIVRRWHFTSEGRPRQGDAFEEVSVYLGDRLQNLSSLDASTDRIERHLFPAAFMPAFFFDGEQAQTLVTNSGEAGMRKAVEVLFGTKVLQDALESINTYVSNSRSKLGGQRNVDSQQQELSVKLAKRAELEKSLVTLDKSIQTLTDARAALEGQQQALSEKLARLGGASREKVEDITRRLERAKQQGETAEDDLFRLASQLGSSLAVSRLAPALLNRLNAERVRESWEAIRGGTIDRADEVLLVAMPEPDDLLHGLGADRREKLKIRFRGALEQIYNPPPLGCAANYVLGHVKGEMRDRLVDLIHRLRRTSGASIQQTVKKLKEAREEIRDAELKRSTLSNLPQEVEEISERLKQVMTDNGECTNELRATEREKDARRADLQALNATIGQLQEQLAALAPDQKRIAVAERCKRTLDTLGDELRPLALNRMQALVSGHFTSIADRRYKNGDVIFPQGVGPVLRREGHPDYLIEMMSGFERRSFGIAFSLALVELTGCRMPLVIDTPLGNADSEYRPRLLKALTSVDLDQIVLLTHDREITLDLFEGVESEVQQTFLMEFLSPTQESVARPDTFFHGIGS